MNDKSDVTTESDSGLGSRSRFTEKGDVKGLFVSTAQNLAQLFVAAVNSQKVASTDGYRRCLSDVRDFVERERQPGSNFTFVNAEALLQFLAFLDSRERQQAQAAATSSPEVPAAAASATASAVRQTPQQQQPPQPPPSPQTTTLALQAPQFIFASSPKLPGASARNGAAFGAHFSRAVGASGPDELLAGSKTGQKRILPQQPPRRASPFFVSGASGSVAPPSPEVGAPVTDDVDIQRFKKIKLDGGGSGGK